MALPLLRLLFTLASQPFTRNLLQIILLVFDSRIRTYGVREFVEHNLCMIPGMISSTSTSKLKTNEESVERRTRTKL